MRNMYLTATEERIRKIRFCKSAGKAIYSIIILTLIIILFLKLDMVMKMQSDTLDQIMEIRMGQEEVEPKINGLSEFNLTDEERGIVLQIVAAESRGEPVEGMMGVAQVIKNRSELWGMTVMETCLAPGQFARPYQGEISPEIVRAVSAVFDEGIEVFSEPVTHFHAEHMNPYWTSSKISRGSIGRHQFWY